MTTEAIPAWPDPSSAEGVTFFGNAQAIVSVFKAHGFQNPAALAMLAMAEAESGLNPNAKGDHDEDGEATAFGLFQWHAPRLDAIRAATGVDIQTAVKASRGDVQSQCEAALWELTTSPKVYGLTAIIGSKTTSAAALQATALFEKAGAFDAAQRRGQMAERWTVYFQKKGF